VQQALGVRTPRVNGTTHAAGAALSSKAGDAGSITRHA
jgi:hypothetical protein